MEEDAAGRRSGLAMSHVDEGQAQALTAMGRTLTEVDLRTSLPSGVPEPGRLPCSMTRLQLLGVQDLAVHRRGSSED